MKKFLDPKKLEITGDEHPVEAPLAVHDLTVSYNNKPVLWDVDLNIPPGKLVAIVGPNGAGKSTLLKAAIDLVPKTTGEVLVFGSPYANSRDRVGYVPQRESVDWDFPISALEVVCMGRYKKIGWFNRVTSEHKKHALDCLEKVGIKQLANRQISQLSGGQQQRVFLARALAQEADLYLMDEPFSAVDAATEMAIVELLRELKRKGKTCVVVHHDLATVSRYFDWLILLNMRVVASGAVNATFTHENLHKTYGGKLNVLVDAAEALSKVAK